MDTYFSQKKEKRVNTQLTRFVFSIPNGENRGAEAASNTRCPWDWSAPKLDVLKAWGRCQGAHGVSIMKERLWLQINGLFSNPHIYPYIIYLPIRIGDLFWNGKKVTLF